MEGLSEDDLIARSGVPAERVRGYVALGVLQPTAQGFRPPDIQLARVFAAFEDAGIAPQQIAELMAQGNWSNAWADLIFPDPFPFSGKTLGELVDGLGLPRPMVERLYSVWQLPRPDWDERVREDDAEVLRVSLVMFEGLARNEDSTVTGAKIFGENVRRIAESQVRYFRAHVEEPLYASGMKMREAIDIAAQLGKSFKDETFHALQILHARHMEHYVMEDVIANLELSLEEAGMAQRRPAKPPAIAFLDLSGYSSLTEKEGDEIAARMAENLGEMVQGAAARHGGRVVKLLGDGVMFHFSEPRDAIHLGLDLVDEAPTRGLPNARMGMHAGPVIYRDADYFGRTVNVAARVADYARPSEVLVTAEAAVAGPPAGVRLVEIGEVTLKGLSRPVSLLQAQRN